MQLQHNVMTTQLSQTETPLACTNKQNFADICYHILCMFLYRYPLKDDPKWNLHIFTQTVPRLQKVWISIYVLSDSTSVVYKLNLSYPIFVTSVPVRQQKSTRLLRV
jgi:hypothetical protein